jgi:hypothetical protein
MEIFIKEKYIIIKPLITPSLEWLSNYPVLIAITYWGSESENRTADFSHSLPFLTGRTEPFVWQSRTDHRKVQVTCIGYRQQWLEPRTFSGSWPLFLQSPRRDKQRWTWRCSSVCLVPELQKPPWPALELSITFRSYHRSKISCLSQGVSMQFCMSCHVLLASIHTYIHTAYIQYISR